MSIENVQEFFTKAQNDPALLQKVREVKNEDLQIKADALAALSAGAGTPFTSEDFVAAVRRSRPVSDSELEDVAGGAGQAPKSSAGPCIL